MTHKWRIGISFVFVALSSARVGAVDSSRQTLSVNCRNNPDFNHRYEASVQVDGSQDAKSTRTLRVTDIANPNKTPFIVQPVSTNSQKQDGFVKFTSQSVNLKIDYDNERCAVRFQHGGKSIEQTNMILEN
jgi:hypothetical protein